MRSIPDLGGRVSTGPPPGQQEVLAIAEKWRPSRRPTTSCLFSAASEPAEAPPGNAAPSPDSRQRSVDGDVLSQLDTGIAARLTDGGRATMRVLLSSNLSRQD